MSLKCGIVGLPNAGKSTIFNALVSADHAETGNYPFCTIDSNKGRVFVPDERLKKISEIIKPQQTIPTSFEFTDIAGLVKGASKGEGLGNQFLSHIRETASLLHVVRSFRDSQISHVYGEPDPVRDMDIINTELQLSDLEITEKRFQKIQKTAQATGDKKLRQECAVLKKALELLSENKSLRDREWSKEEQSFLKPLKLISLKPVLYILNFKEEDFTKKGADNNVEPITRSIRESLRTKEDLISLSCALEEEMRGWTDKEKLEFLKPLGLDKPALFTVIQKVYAQLGLISFFTAGEKEVRAWTVRKGALAPSAGGVIHSDFEKGFIRAEVYSCEDLFAHKSEKILKQKGLVRVVGKDYLVQDGDIIHFLFNV